MKPSNHLLKGVAQAVVLIMFGFTLSCQQQAAIEQSEKEMKAIIEKLEYIWNSGDLAEIEEIFSPKWVHHSKDGVIDTLNIVGRKQFITSIRATYPDFTVKTKQLIIKNDMIVWHCTITGTYNGTDDDSPYTGKKINLPYVSIFRVANGKIVEDWRFWNEALRFKQLGYTITSPSITRD